MSESITHYGDDSEDEIDDGRPENVDNTIFKRKNFKVTTDVKTLKSDMKNYRKNAVTVNKTKRPNAQLGNASVSAVGLVDMIETFDREPDADANTLYAGAGTYSMAGGKGEAGKRLPKVGAYAHAGVAEAHAEASIFSAHARVLHAGAQAEASVNSLGVTAMATAELASASASASASAGPVGIKVGLAADTGLKVGAEGLEAKVLGTGFSVGPKTSVSLLRSEVSFATI